MQKEAAFKIMVVGSLSRVAITSVDAFVCENCARYSETLQEYDFAKKKKNVEWDHGTDHLQLDSDVSDSDDDLY
jgi:hypothetical protein